MELEMNTNWNMFNIIPFTLRIEEYSRFHHFFVRVSFWFGLKMKDTCLENVGRIKVAKSFTKVELGITHFGSSDSNSKDQTNILR